MLHHGRGQGKETGESIEGFIREGARPEGASAAGGSAPSGAAAIGAGATLAMGCTGLKPFRYQGRSPSPVGM